MVTKYGMSDDIGPIALLPAGGKVMFGNGVEEKTYSEKTSQLIDAEVEKIMKNAYSRALEIIQKYRPALDAIVKELVEKETLEQAEYEEIIKREGISLDK
jgi:cell division protease FtsH